MEGTTAMEFLEGVFSAVKAESIRDIAATFMYQGFNPEVIIREVMRLAKEAKLPEDKVQMDIQMMLTLYLSRGTRLAKIQAKSTADAKALIAALKTRYKLMETSQSSGAAAYAPTNLTLARIAQSLSPATCKILHITDSIRIVGDTIDGLPRGLHWGGGASIIPIGDAYEPLFKKWLAYALSFDKVINQSGSDDETRKASILKFGTIIRNNNFIPDKKRKTILTSMGFNHPV